MKGWAARHQRSGSTIDGAVYTSDSAGNRTAKTNQYENVASNYAYYSIYELTMMPERDRKWTLWYTLALVLSVFPLLPLFTYLGRRASGPPAVFCVGMIVVAVWWRWDLSTRAWFWGIILAIVAIHIPLIWFFPWGTSWVPALIRLPFCLVDFYLVTAIISLGEKCFGRGVGAG
jgi:hypothetical protein